MPSTHALTKVTSLADDDVFRFDLDPNNSAVAETVRAVKAKTLKYDVGDVRLYGWSESATAEENDAALLAAVNSSDRVFIKSSGYVSDEVDLLSNQSVISDGSVTIEQTVADKNIFKATHKDNVWVYANGAILFGEGSYSNTRTDVFGHEDRAIQFIKCTRSGIVKPIIKNCGAAGIALIGGTSILIDSPLIEGTHIHDQAISSGDNHQMGLFLKHDSVEGDLDDIRVISPDISGAAQGILVEGYAGIIGTSAKKIVFLAPVIHDIPGQHGFYIQAGGTNTLNPNIDNIALSGVKIQVQEAHGAYIHKSTIISGFNISNTSSQAVEIAVPDPSTGTIDGFQVSGSCHDVLRGVSIEGGTAGSIKNGVVDVVVKDATQQAVNISGVGLENIDVHVLAQGCGRNGIDVDCTNAIGLRLYPRIREANTSVGAFSGIEINASGSEIDIFDMDITDADTNQLNGLFVIDGNVGVYGKTRATGASAYGARANVALTHWPSPEKVTLSGGTAGFLNGHNFRVISPNTFAAADTTPSVFDGDYFETDTGAVTITRFDDVAQGQEFTIVSKGATVFDTSPATRLVGSTVDITTASGDVTRWLCETGGSGSSVCRLLAFVDASVDNSAGA